jgi:hypothetical protein
VPRACFINRFGLKLDTSDEVAGLLNFLHGQEAIRVVE